MNNKRKEKKKESFSQGKKVASIKVDGFLIVLWGCLPRLGEKACCSFLNFSAQNLLCVVLYLPS
jgi:hypothetical protein